VGFDRSRGGALWTFAFSTRASSISTRKPSWGRHAPAVRPVYADALVACRMDLTLAVHRQLADQG
jgi:hypothetical protein